MNTTEAQTTEEATQQGNFPTTYALHHGLVKAEPDAASSLLVEEAVQPQVVHKYTMLAPADIARISTRFGEGQSFQGDYTSTKDDVGLSVAGDIGGKVQLAKNSVFLLLPTGVATICEVKSTVAVIEGRFDGVLEAVAIEIMPGAHITGELRYEEIRIHKGSKVEATHAMA